VTEVPRHAATAARVSKHLLSLRAMALGLFRRRFLRASDCFLGLHALEYLFYAVIGDEDLWPMRRSETN
jgi:hypothetical protein